MVPKEGHVGQFPANFCVKLVGTNADTGETLVTRTCVLEDMNSQCGLFKFQNSTMNGCILTCDIDGCNRGSSLEETFGNLPHNPNCHLSLTTFFYVQS